MAVAEWNVGAASSISAHPVSPRLTKAAEDFESMMMKELLKPMNDEESSDEEGGGSMLGSGSALGEFASEALGRSLSQHGGFGIAKRLVKELSVTNR